MLELPLCQVICRIFHEKTLLLSPNDSFPLWSMMCLWGPQDKARHTHTVWKKKHAICRYESLAGDSHWQQRRRIKWENEQKVKGKRGQKKRLDQQSKQRENAQCLEFIYLFILHWGSTIHGCRHVFVFPFLSLSILNHLRSILWDFFSPKFGTNILSDSRMNWLQFDGKRSTSPDSTKRVFGWWFTC